ncbi:MAG: Hsp20/alpha crystallin family protein [Nitrosarchaeum sp.]|nr:Hsp20/alpha crystallin family protein [Nitrosarchaeum sp.]MCA9820031.1 Hsp20/alpha crystallin family protein [Nitrosarchaeum sp.]
MATNDTEYEIRIIHPVRGSLFSDDIDREILSPLSCLREFGTHWMLEFDLPLVNKKDIKVTFDKNSLSVEAKLKETYYEEKYGIKTKFQFFKKTIILPEKINRNTTSATFEHGRLKIIIFKQNSNQKLIVK